MSTPDHPPVPKRPAPQPPVEPDAFACCGNDCGEACVWTLYRHAQRRYEAALAQWQAQSDAPGEA